MSNKKNLVLNEIYDFLEGFVKYHILEKPIEEGAITDAQRMSLYLPIFRRFIDEQQKSNIEIEENDTYNAVKRARESIDPLFRYCVIDTHLRECYLTDDYETALNKAKTESLKNSIDIYKVLRIVKAEDASYKTVVECFYSDGTYYWDRTTFLHFDYIRQIVSKIEKI